MERKELMELNVYGRVLKMRHDGYSNEEVAKALGISPMRVNLILDEAITELQGDSTKYAVAIRELELLRLETATKLAMSRIESNEANGINLLLKIQDRRARYLGLDTPIKMDGKITIDVPWLTPNRLAYKHADEISPPAEVIELAPAAVPIEQSNTLEEPKAWRESDENAGRNSCIAHDDLLSKR